MNVTIIKERLSVLVPSKERMEKLKAKMLEYDKTFDRHLPPNMSLKEQMLFAKRLAFLTRAGVTILEGLHMIEEQAQGKRYGKIVRAISQDIQEGSSLSRSLGKFPKMFGEFSINIIHIGENSGSLSDNLEYLAEELKKRNDLKNKVISAFIYPAVITVATIGITAFLMLYLFPKLMPIFNSLKMELPLTTKIVIAISVFLQQWGLIALIVCIVLCVAVIVVRRYSYKARNVIDKVLLTLPVVGVLLRTFNLAVDMRTLGLLIRSGTPITPALHLVAKTSHSTVYRQHFENLSEVVGRGEQMSTYMKTQKKDFPPLLTQMVSVGERSGSLSTSLEYLATMYEIEMDDYTKNLASMIEPALMVIMGLVVGLIAVSIITPIYGITEHLKP
jgi:type IV pilus assembly protein PilC